MDDGKEPRSLRDRIVSWLLFAILVEGLAIMTIILGVAIARLFN